MKVPTKILYCTIFTVLSTITLTGCTNTGTPPISDGAVRLNQKIDLNKIPVWHETSFSALSEKGWKLSSSLYAVSNSREEPNVDAIDFTVPQTIYGTNKDGTCFVEYATEFKSKYVNSSDGEFLSKLYMYEKLETDESENSETNSITISTTSNKEVEMFTSKYKQPNYKYVETGVIEPATEEEEQYDEFVAVEAQRDGEVEARILGRAFTTIFEDPNITEEDKETYKNNEMFTSTGVPYMTISYKCSPEKPLDDKIWDTIVKNAKVVLEEKK